MRYHSLIAGIAAGAAGLVLMTAAAQAQPFRLILTHLEAPLVPNSVMDLAFELGYFEQEGVEVELIRVQQTPSALAALQAGEGEMANVAVDALLQLITTGADDLRAVASPNKSLPFLIAARDEIATLDDLAGASFGVGRVGSLDHSLSGLVLGSLGYSLDDMELVTIGQPNVRAQALAAGQIDATTISIGVWSEMPDTEGMHVLVDQDTYYNGAPVINKVNVVPGNVLAERGDEVEAVIRALNRLSRDFRDNPQLWVDAMADARPDVDVEVLEMLSGTFGESWSVNGGMSAAELQYTADWLYETEDFADIPVLTLEQWVDFGPADAVLAELGTDPDLDPADR